MSVMDWVGTIGAVWLAVSILLGIAWALVGRQIFRKPVWRDDIYEPVDDATNGVVTNLDKVTERRNRHGGA